MIEFKQHGFICGMTRSGKTTFGANYFENLSGLRVFFNVQEEYVVQDSADIIVTDVEELTKEINEMNTSDLAICYNPKLAGEDISEQEISTVINMFFAIGSIAKQQVRGQPDIWGTIFIDEIQTYGEKSGQETIHKLFKRGLSYGIRGVGISQRPADVSHTILTQSLDHVIFKLSTYENPYFQRYDIPIKEHEQWLKRDYHFVIWNHEEIIRYTPIQL